MFAGEARLFLCERCFRVIDESRISVVAGFGEGEENKNEKSADQGSCYIIGGAPGVVDGYETGCC